MISTSETTVSLTVSPVQILEGAVKDLKEFANVAIDYGKYECKKNEDVDIILNKIISNKKQLK